MSSSLRRLVSVPAALLSGSLLFAGKALAFGTQPNAIPIGSPDIRATITNLINIALNLLGLLAAVVVIIAGIRLIFSQGDEEAKETAKKTVLYAVMGLIIILFAKAIVVFVMSLG